MKIMGAGGAAAKLRFVHQCRARSSFCWSRAQRGLPPLLCGSVYSSGPADVFFGDSALEFGVDRTQRIGA
jgi:hypothetical protein